MIMKKLFRTLCFLCLTTLTWTAQAEDASWYQIEVLVFANEDPSALDDEFWPKGLDIRHPANSVKLRVPGSNGGHYDPYELLPSSAMLLNDEKARMVRSGQYRPLFHAGWLQPVEQQNRATPIHIQAGDMLDNGMYELEGYITIDRGRYLHFKPDLYHSKKLTEYESQLLREFLTPDQPPTVTEVLGDNSTSETASAAAIEPLSSPALLELPEFLTVNMKQGRRMRSQELHYLDHPLMGILVVMLPVDKK